VGKLDIHEK